MDPKAPPPATTSSGDTASKHIKIAMAKLLTLCFAAASAFQVPTKLEPVSYTHLTLPTKA